MLPPYWKGIQLEALMKRVVLEGCQGCAVPYWEMIQLETLLKQVALKGRRVGAVPYWEMKQLEALLKQVVNGGSGVVFLLRGGEGSIYWKEDLK